jgi:predicted O-methyltransferase YrrM
MARRTRLLLAIARVVDIVALPLTALAGAWLRSLRFFGLQYLPGSKRTLLFIGVLPVRDHYYEPMINPKHLRHQLSCDRSLPAVDMNVAEQLSILEQFTFQSELTQFPLDQAGEMRFHYRNASFEAGDAEYLYSLLRLVKPKKLIEIGSGHSTLLARSALDRNRAENPSFECEHVCIEPYEQPWLEKLGVQVIRRRVEECGTELFKSLGKGDVLFIDSSHVIRPQGDVVFEYLELLPILNSGVYVHIHDIFTPRDYPPQWVVEEIRLWNEQYLLEAFLSFNTQFRVVGAVNFLAHHYPKEISERFPILRMEIEKKEPGSFWMVKQ